MKPIAMLSSLMFAVLGGVPLTASAASTVWDFNTACTSGCSTGSVSAGNTAVFNNGELVASAWSSGATDTTGSNSAGADFASAQLKNYGSQWGWGVIADPAGTSSESNNTGPHAMDNIRGTDMIMLSFDDKVALNSVTIGWNGTDNPVSITSGSTTYNYNDSDISVLWFDGDVDPVIAGKDITGLLTAGWKLLSDFSNVGASNGSNPGGAVNFNAAGAVSSSWWLVSAYNKNFDGNTSDTSGFSSGNDAVKIMQVAGNVIQTPPPVVPEPASLMLFGAGLFGLMALRRRHQA